MRGVLTSLSLRESRALRPGEGAARRTLSELTARLSRRESEDEVARRRAQFTSGFLVTGVRMKNSIFRILGVAGSVTLGGCGIEPETLHSVRAAIRTASAKVEDQQPAQSSAAAFEFEPPYPERVDPFTFPAESGSPIEDPGTSITSAAQVVVLGFADVDGARVFLSIKGKNGIARRGRIVSRRHRLGNPLARRGPSPRHAAVASDDVRQDGRHRVGAVAWSSAARSQIRRPLWYPLARSCAAPGSADPIECAREESVRDSGHVGLGYRLSKN